MLTTAKYSCRLIAAALVRYGVRRVVVSPGSRNAPLIMALTRTPQLQVTEIIDERSAAFVALGMAVQSLEPVAVVCTSGSAVLNYAPAFAEAYYRHVPLIAVTADRPEEWIDQDDGQTIRQQGALQAVVKATYDLPLTRDDAGLERLCCRRAADALMMAVAEPSGPVHINVHIDEPLDVEQDDVADAFLLPEYLKSEPVIPKDTLRMLADEIHASERVLVLAGFMSPDEKLRSCLERMPGNVAVIAEMQSNLGPLIPCNIDAMLRMPGASELLPPDIVITIGGGQLSRAIKEALRSAPAGMRHWSVSCDDHCVDPFLHLDRRISCTPAEFMAALEPLLHESTSDYAYHWKALSASASECYRMRTSASPWKDSKAVSMLLGAVPEGTSLHLGNGMSVRYAHMCGCPGACRTECNRGVNGIDGSTSTAVGASMAYNGPTLLVTGDMAAQYDMAALAAPAIPSSFRMAVVNNGGGGIFRLIKSTREIPEMERWLAGDVRLPLRQLAEGFGFDYYEATDESSLQAQLPAFFAVAERPAILNILTPPKGMEQPK